MVMTEHEILSCLAKIIEETAGIPASKVVALDADITDDLGISSLAMVEIIVSLEDKFSVEIPDEALKDLRTIRDVVSYMQGVQHSGAGPNVQGDSASEVAAT
jgi:acyl carrier protein